MSLLIMIRFMLALDLCLVCAEDLIPGAHGVLPIGGSHIVQVGTALIMAFVIYEIADACGKVFHTIRQYLKGGRVS